MTPVADTNFSLVEFTNMKDGWDEVVRNCANVALECQILLGQDLKQEIFQHFESDQKCGLILFWLHKILPSMISSSLRMIFQNYVHRGQLKLNQKCGILATSDGCNRFR